MHTVAGEVFTTSSGAHLIESTSGQHNTIHVKEFTDLNGDSAIDISVPIPGVVQQMILDRHTETGQFGYAITWATLTRKEAWQLMDVLRQMLLHGETK